MLQFGSWFSGLRGKLLLLVGIPMAILVVVSSIAVLNFRSQDHKLGAITETQVPETVVIGHLRMNNHAVMRFLWTAFVDKSARKEQLNLLSERIRQESDDIHKFQTFHLDETSKSKFAVVPDIWDEMIDHFSDAILLLEKNTEVDDQTAKRIILEKLAGPSGHLVDVLKDCETAILDRTNTLGKGALADSHYAVTVVLAASFIGFIFSLIFGLFTSSRLSRNLIYITQEVSSSSQQVDAASGQLAAAGQQLSTGATQGAASLEETVASLEELSSMVKLNAENAYKAADLSQDGKQAAERGETEIHQLISAMDAISNSSKKIEEIINVIDDIAFQTNILALNAAVEAARAGEQGKGFAVVAEAVRNLAQKSGNAAKEITTLIKDSGAKVENGAKIANQSASVLNTIVTSIKKIADLNKEIASASQEQSTGIGQINTAMNQLDQVTQNNASSAEESAAASEELSSQSKMLQEMVNNLSKVVYGANHSMVQTTNTSHNWHETLKLSVPGNGHSRQFQAQNKKKGEVVQLKNWKDKQPNQGKQQEQQTSNNKNNGTGDIATVENWSGSDHTISGS